MRTAIVIARRHGSKKFELLAGPDQPVAQILRDFKETRRQKAHARYEQIEIWTSDHGRVKKHALLEPKALAAREAAEEAAREAAEKAQADAAKKAAGESSGTPASAGSPVADAPTAPDETAVK